MHPFDWTTTASKTLIQNEWLTLHEDTCEMPDGTEIAPYYTMHYPDWVNIVALTPDREVVMINQYRHGTETVELEIPGGMMDPGDTDPVATALRELQEETGYTGENARPIGECFANPAIMNNRVHTVLVENCRLTHEVQLDDGEDLATHLVPAADLPRLVKEQKIQHSTIVAALHYFALER